MFASSGSMALTIKSSPAPGVTLLETTNNLESTKRIPKVRNLVG